MKIKILFSICNAAFLFASAAQGQVFISPGYLYFRSGPQRYLRKPQQQLPHFDPVVEISLGSGFPKLDKNYLPDYYQTYHGTTS